MNQPYITLEVPEMEFQSTDDVLSQGGYRKNHQHMNSSDKWDILSLEHQKALKLSRKDNSRIVGNLPQIQRKFGNPKANPFNKRIF